MLQCITSVAAPFKPLPATLRRHRFRALAAATLGLLLAACGQKGPLMLANPPASAQETQAAQAAPASPAAASPAASSARPASSSAPASLPAPTSAPRLLPTP